MLDALIPQLFVKGLSVRDVSDAFGEVLQEEGVSPATASRVAQSIRVDFEAWRSRSLSGQEVLYLFVDGMYLKLHPDQPEKQPILIAYAILWSLPGLVQCSCTWAWGTAKATRPAWGSCGTWPNAGCGRR
jgi:transposase-like protein